MEECRYILKKFYGHVLGEIKAIEKNKKRTTNHLYKVYAKNGIFFFKKGFEFSHIKEEMIYNEMLVLKLLYENKYPVIMPLKNIKGKYLTQVGKKFYWLYPFYELDDSPEFGDEHMMTSIKLLAKFHKIGEQFKTDFEFNSNPLHSSIKDITCFTINKHNKYHKYESVELRVKKLKNGFSKKVNSDSKFIKNLIIEIVDYLYKNKEKFTKKTLLHYDYNKDNLLYYKGKLLAVTDFEYSHIGYIESDLTKAAKYWAEDNNYNFDIVKFKNYIIEYNKINSVSQDWELYYMLLNYIVLRRLIYSMNHTAEKKAELEFLYDIDMKLLRSFKKNKDYFLS